MNWGRFGKTIETQTSITLFYKINFHENLKNHTSTFENTKKLKFSVQILKQNQNAENEKINDFMRNEIYITI